MLPQLSIIVVSWNTKDMLRQCLRSIYESTRGLAYEIFVVDNASSDGTVAMIESEFPHVILIKNIENVGFAKANNQAMRKSRGKYILLLNPDTMILDNAIIEMKDFMDTNTMAGIATCKILNPDKTIQLCYGEFPSLETIIFGGSTVRPALHSLFLTKRFFKDAGLSTNEYNQRQKVDWIMGAFMMVRKEVADQVGLLDEKLFMYGEEPDWCYRITRHGWGIWYVPEPKIIHYGGQSTEQVTGMHTIDWLLKTQYYFFLKHYGKPQMILAHFTGLASSIIKLGLFGALSILFLGSRRREFTRRKLRYFFFELKWHLANTPKKLSRYALVHCIS